MSDHRPHRTGDTTGGMPPVWAVVPVAGLPTRFPPAGKTAPKPLFSLVDRPAPPYVAAAAAAAGVTDVTLAVGPDQHTIADHFASQREHATMRRTWLIDEAGTAALVPAREWNQPEPQG